MILHKLGFFAVIIQRISATFFSKNKAKPAIQSSSAS